MNIICSSESRLYFGSVCCVRILDIFEVIATQFFSEIAKCSTLFQASQLAMRLWGDIYFNPQKRCFQKTKSGPDSQRSFVQWILEPLYKIFSQTIGDVDTSLAKTVQELGIHLSKTELKMNIRPLLRVVCSRFFGDFTGFVDMIADKIPAAKHGVQRIVNDAYSGSLKTDFVKERVDYFCDNSKNTENFNGTYKAET